MSHVIPRKGITGLECVLFRVLIWPELFLHVIHDDVIKCKHFPCYWLFVRRIHRSPQKVQWHGALIFSLMCAWTNGRTDNGDAGDLRCLGAYCDVTVMNYLFNTWFSARDFIPHELQKTLGYISIFSLPNNHIYNWSVIRINLFIARGWTTFD